MVEEEKTFEEPQKSFEELEKELNDELTSEELREKNKQLFARAKKAEEVKKRLEAELMRREIEEKKKSEEKPEEKVSPDMTDLVKKISALKDYSSEELDYISLISKAKNIPLEEAARSEEVQLYIQARREKVAKQTTPPPPSTKTLPEKKEFSEWTSEDIKNAALEDLEEFRKWAKAQRR